MIAVTEKHFHYAARLSGAAMKLREQTDPQFAVNEQMEYDESLEELPNHMDGPLFTTLQAEGEAMTITEAAAYALTQ